MTMQSIANDIEQLARQLPAITLEEMSGIRLMNRTDNKYVTTADTLKRLLALTKGNYYAQEIDGMRVSPYATTYWDDAETHAMFRQHEKGHRPRTKVRVRTYLNSGTTFLEVKKKDNHGKTQKTRIKVASAEDVMEGTGAGFVLEQTGMDLARLEPTVSNRFNRLTLVNMAKTERLTIDFDIRFHNFLSGDDAEMDNVVVIELKRDGRCPSPILPLLRQLRIKPSGFSKYCIGAAVTDHELHINRFKKRLIKLNKVSHPHTPSTQN